MTGRPAFVSASQADRGAEVDRGRQVVVGDLPLRAGHQRHRWHGACRLTPAGSCARWLRRRRSADAAAAAASTSACDDGAGGPGAGDGRRGRRRARRLAAGPAATPRRAGRRADCAAGSARLVTVRLLRRRRQWADRAGSPALGRARATARCLGAAADVVRDASQWRADGDLARRRRPGAPRRRRPRRPRPRCRTCRCRRRRRCRLGARRRPGRRATR